MRRLALGIALGFFAGPLAAETPDAAALLAETAAVYRRDQPYYFAASEKTVTASGDFRKETVNMVLTAKDAAGRLRVEFDDRTNAGVAVFDGTDTWVYLPRRARYAKLPAPDSPLAKVESLDFGTLAKRFGDRYRPADQRVLQAAAARSETIRLKDGERDCHVVEVSYDPPPGIRDGRVERIYWIDKASGLIVREHSVASMPSPQTPARRVTVTQDIEFQVAAVGGPIDEDLFVFAPPPGARRVESLADDSSPSEDLDAEAPDFTLKTLTGQEVRLSSLRGKVVLLDFWATWCGPCRYDMPHVQRLHEELRAEGLEVFGVNSESPVVAQAYLAENDFTFPTLADAENRVAGLFRVNAIPTFVVIDRQGRLRSYMVGTRPHDVLRKAVEDAGL